MPYERINNVNMVAKAERLINDNVPTVAMFEDPRDELFNITINEYEQLKMKGVL